MSERKLVKIIKDPVIASDEGAKQSLDLSELTLEIAPRGHLRLRQKTPLNDRNMPKSRVFVQALDNSLSCKLLFGILNLEIIWNLFFGICDF